MVEEAGFEKFNLAISFRVGVLSEQRSELRNDVLWNLSEFFR